MSSASSDHWQKHAAQWRNIGPPLRPHPQDVKIFESIASGQNGNTPKMRVLLLGVTPELVMMDWPSGTTLLAMDRCAGMINQVWPGGQRSHSYALLGDWRIPPLAPSVFDLIIGDGCLTTLDYPVGYLQVCKSLHRLLKPGGQLALRCFLQSDCREELSAVLNDLKMGKISSFHACKWRIAMALHGGTASEGVRLSDIWEVWHEWQLKEYNFPMRSGSGWSDSAVQTIDNYQGVSTTYSFPTKGEIRKVFSERFFQTESHSGNYELADRCPIMVFRPSE